VLLSATEGSTLIEAECQRARRRVSAVNRLGLNKLVTLGLSKPRFCIRWPPFLPGFTLGYTDLYGDRGFSPTAWVRLECVRRWKPGIGRACPHIAWSDHIPESLLPRSENQANRPTIPLSRWDLLGNTWFFQNRLNLHHNCTVSADTS